MLDIIGRVLESTIGVPLFGLGALTLVFVVYRMARHEILLFGHVEDIENHQSNKYSFYVQNLEHVSFPGPFCISLRDKRPEARADTELAVRVYSGPKHVVRVLPDSADKRSRVWTARFEELPPLDTWLLVCEDESSWLELSFDTGEENTGIKPKLIKDVSRRHLSIRPDRPGESYEGLTHTPSLGVFFGTLAAAILAYLGSVPLLNLSLFQKAFRITPFNFDWMDLLAVLLIALLVFLGFKSIRRSVYPIIQGYFEETVVIDPKAATLAPKTDNDRAAGASSFSRLFGIIRKRD